MRKITGLLVANRGEIAIRIFRAATELGIDLLYGRWQRGQNVVIDTVADVGESSEVVWQTHLAGGQVVFLAPGTFGSYLIAKRVRDAGNAAVTVLVQRRTDTNLRRGAKGAQVKFTLHLAAQLGMGRIAVTISHEADYAVAMAFGLSAEETAIAKAYCNQAGFEVASEALQVMGGLGYSQEELVEYCLRRCRGWMIAGGSIEMLKNRIAEHVFDRRFDQRPPKPKSAEAAE